MEKLKVKSKIVYHNDHTTIKDKFIKTYLSKYVMASRRKEIVFVTQEK